MSAEVIDARSQFNYEKAIDSERNRKIIVASDATPGVVFKRDCANISQLAFDYLMFGLCVGSRN